MILIVGLASDKLKAKSVLPTRLTVDSRETRQSSALVTRPSAMAIAMGKDQGFFELVRRGNVLKIDNAELKLSVNLRGSGKALTDLGACVETEGKSLPKIQTAATPTSPAEVPVQAAPSEPAPAPVPAPEPASAPVAASINDLPPVAPAPEQLAALPHPADSTPKAVPLAPAPAPAPAPVSAPSNTRRACRRIIGAGFTRPAGYSAFRSRYGRDRASIAGSGSAGPASGDVRAEIWAGIRRHPRGQHHRQPQSDRVDGTLMSRR